MSLSYFYRKHIADVGIFAFLHYFMPDHRAMLKSVCEALGLPERETADDMVKSIADEV